jgi:hypothetical protein
MPQGTDRWQAAGWLAMTEQLEDGYGHHHPDFQEEAAERIRRTAVIPIASKRVVYHDGE